jgi:hypothetical protein
VLGFSEFLVSGDPIGTSARATQSRIGRHQALGKSFGVVWLFVGIVGLSIMSFRGIRVSRRDFYLRAEKKARALRAGLTLRHL